MFTPDYECLIELMAEIRKDKGVTQVDLATALGKPQSFVSKIENGERQLDLIEMVAVADALGIKPQTVIAMLEERISRPVRI